MTATHAQTVWREKLKTSEYVLQTQVSQSVWYTSVSILFPSYSPLFDFGTCVLKIDQTKKKKKNRHVGSNFSDSDFTCNHGELGHFQVGGGILFADGSDVEFSVAQVRQTTSGSAHVDWLSHFHVLQELAHLTTVREFGVHVLEVDLKNDTGFISLLILCPRS